MSPQDVGTLMKQTGRLVLSRGGVVTDVKSFGKQELAYTIRRPGERHNEVSGGGWSVPGIDGGCVSAMHGEGRLVYVFGCCCCREMDMHACALGVFVINCKRVGIAVME